MRVSGPGHGAMRTRAKPGAAGRTPARPVCRKVIGWEPHAWQSLRASPGAFLHTGLAGVLHTGLAGVRPAAPGFARVRIAPCPGPLTRIASKTPHPDGLVETDLAFDGQGRVTGTVTLPAGLTGEFVWNGKALPLKPGAQPVQ
jgi:hypothetical protein